jgi:uncharacterized protein (DUF362 family)
MRAKRVQAGVGGRCGGVTRRGTPCQRRVPRGQVYCALHRDTVADAPQKPACAGDVTPGQGAPAASAEGVRVVVMSRKGRDTVACLGATLEQAGFWECLEATRTACGCAKAELRILIKPDLELFDLRAPTGVDPEVVEHLIALLHRRGYAQVVVADGLGSADLWLENREVAVLADLVGYRYVTADGRPYAVVNLSDDLIPAGFPEGSVLYGIALGRAWVEAQFRISVAKNKTHEEYFFALGAQNLLGVLPLRDKEYHYAHRLDPGEVCVEVLRHTPVHFSLIEALVSNHGQAGTRRVTPLATETLIASANVVLADWVAAMKMGLDPYASPVNATVLRTIGLPRRYHLQGDLRPYPGWQNVPLLVADSVRRRNRSVVVHQIVRPWLQAVNPEVFPFKNSVDAQMNQVLGRVLRETDQHPLADWAMVGINYGLAAVQTLLEGYAILYDKDRVRRQQGALGLDVARYARGEYEAMVDYLEPLAQIAAQTPPDRNGLRWRYLDQSVLFEFVRHLPIPFDEFVSRVDIGAAVRLMNDNIGGACVPVVVDAQGRVTHQAERNIYLPQPNWMVLFGGSVIDVGKLEFIRYEADRQQIFWRTVTSANHSATFDDGLVTFARDAAGHTVISIVARQQFTLPLFWQVINMDFLPQVKAGIVSEAYVTFFTRTIANFEAVFEGREVAMGRAWDPEWGEPGGAEGRLPLEQVAEVVMKLVGGLEPLVTHLLEHRTPTNFDKFGLTSFIEAQNKQKDSAFIDAATNPVRTFFVDLFDAVKKDLSMMKRMSEEDIL